MPDELADLPSVTTLDLSDNRITGTVTKAFARKLTANNTITTLDLSDNRIAGTLPAELGGATTLRKLHLHDNSLSRRSAPSAGSADPPRQPQSRQTRTVPPRQPQPNPLEERSRHMPHNRQARSTRSTRRHAHPHRHRAEPLLDPASEQRRHHHPLRRPIPRIHHQHLDHTRPNPQRNPRPAHRPHPRQNLPHPNPSRQQHRRRRLVHTICHRQHPHRRQ